MSYPPGCTQAMIDRAFADEDREKCQECRGAGEMCVVCGEPLMYCKCEFCDPAPETAACPNCHGTGYEPRPDNSDEDERYDASLDDDVAF